MPGLLDSIKTEMNWGGMFPDKEKIASADKRYIDDLKAVGKEQPNAVDPQYRPDYVPPTEEKKPGLFQTIANSIGSLFPPGKIISPIAEDQTPMPTKAQPTPTKEPTPTSKPSIPAVLASSSTMKPQSSGLPEGVTSTKGVVPSEPPAEISQIIDKVFGDKAPVAKIVAFSENGGYRPDAVNVNTDGSKDVGIFQVNDNTFNDYMRRMPKVMEGMGITSFDDMYDPQKNTQMASLIHKYQGWGAWYGPKNRGFIIKES